MTRILVSVGEPSAEAYAAQVVRAALHESPSLEIEAVGGPVLAAAGATLVASSDGLSAMGTVETLGSLATHARLRRQLARRLQGGRYDLALLLDYPGFHLSVARIAARHGVPVLYYVAPQLWAWGEWRVARLRKHVNALAVILPFEQRFFGERGIPSTFVGHPLLDRDPPPSRQAARCALGVPADARVLALFPGSRDREIGRVWPVFRDAARLLQTALPGLRVLVAGTAEGVYPHPGDLLVKRGASHLVHAAADAAICKSGTTTLEAALQNTPMVIAYRTHPVTYRIARRAVTVPHVGLVNLILGRQVVPEFLQDAATPAALADAALPLFDTAGRVVCEQREAFAETRSLLGTPGVAQRVAAMALALVA